jgi:hypothetical protein
MFGARKLRVSDGHREEGPRFAVADEGRMPSHQFVSAAQQVKHGSDENGVEGTGASVAFPTSSCCVIFMYFSRSI